MAAGVFDNSMTVMKYRIGKNYDFKVMDRFDESDEVKRLNKMLDFSRELDKLHAGYEQLWIKTCPLFAIPKNSKDSFDPKDYKYPR